MQRAVFYLLRLHIPEKLKLVIIAKEIANRVVVYCIGSSLLSQVKTLLYPLPMLEVLVGGGR